MWLSPYRIKEQINKHMDDSEYEFYVSEDCKNIISKSNGEVICTMSDYIGILRRKLHCDFETIYYEHCMLDHVYRCRECGTVIFGGDDERFNENECCPTCCHDDKVCFNKYWTKDEIEASKEKQDAIKWYTEMQKFSDEREARRKARNGLYDWQRWETSIIRKKKHTHITLINWSYDYKKKLNLFKQDAYFEIEISKPDKELDNVFVVVKRIKIPLTIYAWYVRIKCAIRWKKEKRVEK